jgi:hypothetical protein
MQVTSLKPRLSFAIQHYVGAAQHRDQNDFVLREPIKQSIGLPPSVNRGESSISGPSEFIVDSLQRQTGRMRDANAA